MLEGVLARLLLLIPFEGNPPRNTLASTPSSTRNFPSTLPSHFLGFPASLISIGNARNTVRSSRRPCPRRPRPLDSRLSFPATEPPGFRRVGEGVSEGISEGFSKGFGRVLEGFWKGSAEDPSKTLRKPFRDPFRDPLSNPSETLLGSGGSVAGNERPRPLDVLIGGGGL